MRLTEYTAALRQVVLSKLDGVTLPAGDDLFAVQVRQAVVNARQRARRCHTLPELLHYLLHTAYPLEALAVDLVRAAVPDLKPDDYGALVQELRDLCPCPLRTQAPAAGEPAVR